MKEFKKVCILFALKKEYKGFTECFTSNLKEVAQKPFFCCKFLYKNFELFFAVSGLGKVRAAACTQYLIDKYNPDLIINAGSAGGVCPKVVPKDVYFVTTLVEYDFKSIREKTPIFSIEPNLVNIAKKINIPLAVLGSADQNADSEMKKDALHKIGVTIADWEGIGVVKTCQLNSVSCAVFKVVTDTSTNDFTKEFSQNVYSFNNHLNKVVLSFLDTLLAELQII